MKTFQLAVFKTRKNRMQEHGKCSTSRQVFVVLKGRTWKDQRSVAETICALDLREN